MLGTLLMRLRRLYYWLTPRRFAVLMGVTTVAHIVFALTADLDSGVDGYIYQRVAESINRAPDLPACGAFEGAYWPPLFCIYLASFWKLFGQTEWLFFLFNIGIALTTALISRRYLEAIFTGPTALWAALLSYNSMMIYYFTVFYKYELLAALFLAVSFLLIFRSQGRGAAVLFAAGLTMGLAALTTARVLVLVPPLVWYMYRRRPAVPRARATVGVVLFVAALALTTAPWAARNYACFDRFIPFTSNSGINFYMGFYEGADGGFKPKTAFPPPANTWDRTDNAAFYRAGWQYIQDNPGRAAYLMLRKLYLMWRIHYFDMVFFYPFFWVGIFLLARFLPPERRAAARTVQMLFLFYALFHTLYIARHFYVIPLLALLYGVAVQCQWFVGHRLRQRFAPASPAEDSANIADEETRKVI